MKDRLAERLRTLKEEYARGQEELTKLEAKAVELKKMMTRIEGAVQVLEEELAKFS